MAAVEQRDPVIINLMTGSAGTIAQHGSDAALQIQQHIVTTVATSQFYRPGL
ncbi:MAG: hypothetical protein NZ703_00150 [Gemmataceae bacterium]|nr:hypothetical protein [Gemmataceae bacterium]MCS7269472.1 hypothetical protein [Gemmataceae bacterium]MDW8243947.1 hypothetical protein [Thermogemmata sp.]